MADGGDEWKPFFERVKSRPPAFYAKCAARLEGQDIFEPADLAEVDEELFIRQLTAGDAPATAGEVSFLRQVIELARVDAGKGSAQEDPCKGGPMAADGDPKAKAKLEAAEAAVAVERATAEAAEAAVAVERARTAAAEQERCALEAKVSSLEAALKTAEEKAFKTAEEKALKGTSEKAGQGQEQGRGEAPEEPSGPPARPTAPVVPVILPGNEDPAEILKRGGLELEWKSGGRTTKVRKFRAQAIPHIVSEDLALPTLYLHFLDKRFRPESSSDLFDNALRSGNDNAEIQIILPSMYMDAASFGLGGDVGRSLSIALEFVKSHGETEISALNTKAGGFTPKPNYSGTVSPQRVYLSLMTARPKAPISLDRRSFGIPSNADIYLFAQNHASVAHMTKAESEAFQACIAELPEESNDDLKKLAIFFKIFYEGGFAYNHKEMMQRGYLPRNVGIAGLGLVPSFQDQVGIGTGYPYILESRFLRFSDTVPVTIPAISQMSPRHGRYGLCFTRVCFVWEDEALAREGVLKFSCLTPNGGFFYLPSRLWDYHNLGGLVYAFGEAKEEFEVPVSTEGGGGQSNGSQAASASAGEQPQDRPQNRQVCVICLTESAEMAAVPCGHRAYCSSCSPNATGRTCPVCRQRVTSIIRVY